MKVSVVLELILLSSACAFQQINPSHGHSLNAQSTSELVAPAAPVVTPSLEDVSSLLSQLYGHERVRRLNAAMSKSNFLAANPNVDKRHMTYGELPLELFQTTLSRIATHLDRKGSFVDLGSGVGRLTIAASLLAPPGVFTGSKGVEIIQDLHETAMDAQARAFSLLPHYALPISFHQGDAFDPNNGLLTDASALYCYSTTWECDEDLVMRSLSESLATAMQNGSIVAMTDRKLAHPFVLVDSITGSNPEKGGPTATSTVNVYRLSKAYDSFTAFQ